MIKWRFHELARERGHRSLRTLLINHGFSDDVAGNISRDEIKRYPLGYLWKLMRAFRCDLNALVALDDVPPSYVEEHPYLESLQHEKMTVDISQSMTKMTEEELRKLSKSAEEILKERGR